MSEKIPKGWKWVKLGEVAEIVKDIVNPNEFDDLNYIGLEHIGQENLRIISIGKSREVNSTKYLFKPNDILFGKLRPYFRKVVKPKFNGICSTDIWVFRAKQGYDQNYLYYFLANWDFVNLASSGEGGTRMPRADWNYLKQTEWIFPPLPEQKAIAEVLSSIDDKIDLLHRQNKTLEEMAMTLFRQWFIEPTKDELPEGWEEVRLGEIIEISSGKSIEKGKLKEKGLYPVLGANGEIGRTDDWLYEGELIYTGRVGTLGNVFIVFRNEKVWLTDNTLVIKPNKNEYFYFVYFTLKNAKLDEYNSGSTQPLIRQSDIKKIEIFLPKINFLKDFEIISRNIFIKIQFNTSQIQTLDKLRDTLLPKLMSGELRVKV